MKFFNKFASAVLTAGMLFSTPAASAMAMSTTTDTDGIAPYASGVTIRDGVPSSSEAGKDLNAGSVVKNVGDTGFYQRLPRLVYTHNYCGNVATEFIPEYYQGVSYTLSNPDVLANVEFSVDGYKGNEDGGFYNGLPCLTLNYDAVKAGTTTVNLTFYYSYEADADSGYCSFCGNYVSTPSNYKVYKDTVTFVVTVKDVTPPVQEVTVTYTDGVENETVFPDQGYEVTVGSKTPAFVGTPTRDGYTFMGWAPAVSEYVQGEVTYVATWTKNPDPVEPVDPEEPEDPKKISLPSLDKTIIVNGEEKDETEDVAPGDTVQFALKSNIPSNLFDYMSNHTVDADGKMTVEGSYPMVFHDKIDGAWSDPTNLTVSINGTAIDATYYAVTQNAPSLITVITEDGEVVDTPTVESCNFHVALDLIKLYNDGIITDEDIKNAVPIVVTYDSTLHSEASAAAHTNTAWVTFPGKDGEQESEKDTVTADVYGVEITKVDSSDDTILLANATFVLKDADGNEIATLTTDENGKAVFDGLKPGDYSLTETAAPEGYVRATAPINFTISKNSTGDDHRYETNIKNTQAPSTGGAGTAIFTVAGAGLLASAAILLTIRKKETAE